MDQFLNILWNETENEGKIFYTFEESPTLDDWFVY